MIVRAPLKIPDTPRPAMARPIISAVEVGAIPHMREPNSKMDTEPMKNHFIEND